MSDNGLSGDKQDSFAASEEEKGKSKPCLLFIKRAEKLPDLHGRLPVYVFVLLIAGIYFSAYQLSAAYPKFEYTLNAMTFVFLIAVPILTMRVLAEERKQKTDQLLLTSPVSVSGIVMGKYLALVTIYAIPIAVLATYPLIMSKFGTVAFGSAYTALLGFSFWEVQTLQLAYFSQQSLRAR